MTIAEESMVFLVDDDAAVRTGLTRLLRAEGLSVRAFESCEAFLAADEPPAAACLVLDVSLPGLDGPGLQRELLARGRSTPVIFLTGKGDIPTSVRAMKAGAADFLTKPATADVLVPAVRAAIETDRAARRTASTRAAIESSFAALTPREQEVMRHVIAGKPNKRIAADLGTTEKTVKVHRGRVMSKMGVQSVADLVRVSQAARIDPAG